MANALYGLGRQSFLAGQLDWSTDDIRVILVDVGYSVSIDTHQFLDSVGSGTRVATSGALGTKSVTLGVANAANVTFTAVTGNEVTQVIIYQHTGTESTSRLIAHIDTDDGGAISVTPNGGDITINWDTGANKIFKL